jgi:hypothetical protein
MLRNMFWFLLHFKAAWCDSNNDLKKVAWKAWALLRFFAQTIHNSSVSHSQFDNHLIMPWISQLHPLYVAVMHPKKIHAFCGQWPWCPCAALCPSPRSTSHSHGSPSRDRVYPPDTSEDGHFRDATVRVLIEFRGAHWRYWKNCPHLPFVSQQDE